jgi:hypothetical protein
VLCSLEKREEEDAIFYLKKNGIFFPIFKLTNQEQSKLYFLLLSPLFETLLSGCPVAAVVNYNLFSVTYTTSRVLESGVRPYLDVNERT